jgi:hypothetical protein
MTISSPVPAPPTANELAVTLNQIRGVYASCVILDKNHKISEIHIVASNARKPKPIVRDIETMIFVKHGIKIDYRAISMVQISDEQLLRIPIARPEIREVTEEVTGNQRRIRVKIHGASRIAVGEATERIDNPSPFRTAAKATINALERLLNNTIDVRLDQAQTFGLGLREILIVVVTSFIDGHEETFVGSSFVNERPIESAARATLDALNRRIQNLTLQAPREGGEEV